MIALRGKNQMDAIYQHFVRQTWPFFVNSVINIVYVGID